MNNRIPVAVVRCGSYDRNELRTALEKVLSVQLESFGSLHGKSVLLKPNLLAWRKKEDIACVHPAFLTETARLFLDAGAARVAVMENPAVQTTPMILSAMGIADELRKMNVECANFSGYCEIPPPENVRFHHLLLAPQYREFDAVADLAKTKTHGMMTLTMCVKNLFGFVSGPGRLGWHLRAGRDFETFADMLLDLYLTIRPAFSFLDGVVCMEGNGPGSGTPAERGFLAGSADALALDRCLAEMLGVPDLMILRQAKKRDLLPAYDRFGDVTEIRPLLLPDPPGALTSWGVTLPPFGKRFLREHVLAKPVLDGKKCIGCGLCVKMCPPQSLKMGPQKKPVFHLPECIRCFCCQEHCPQGAIRPEKTLLLDLTDRLSRLFRRRASHAEK